MKTAYKNTVVAALAALVLLAALPAAAQSAADAAENRLPDRIMRPMRAIDPMTLRAEGVTIRLWGIKPAQSNDTPLELRALSAMDALIQEQQVNCKIAGGKMPELVGRCVTQNNQDLALELLGNGYAVVDRRQTYDTVFASGYEKAQETARLQARGVWAFLAEDAKAPAVPAWMQSGILLPLVLVAGPLLGLLIVAFVLWRGMQRLAEGQSHESVEVQRKEAMLMSRERQVLVTTLEGELMENKNKIEAFLAIYGDLLRSLRDTSETPKYQQVGDIVQKHPMFSKTVFESNVAKLGLLDMHLAGQLSKLYAAMPKEPEYINLDQNVQLETAVALVEKILRDAEDLLVPLNQILRELQDAADKDKS